MFSLTPLSALALIPLKICPVAPPGAQVQADMLSG